jgi:hypothetical protein
MGYASTVSGELTITPPLKWGQFKNNEFFEGSPTWKRNVPCIRLVDDKYEDEHEDGTTTIITCEIVQPASEDRMKAYDLISEVQRLVDAFPGHTFGGEFLVEGEQTGDIWKLVVGEDRKVEKIRPRIVWPDGTELPVPD